MPKKSTAQKTKPAKKPAPATTPYPGYEPYDVVQVCDEGTWTDFETIRTPAEGEHARKLCELTGERTYRITASDKQTVKVAPPAPKAKKARAAKATPVVEDAPSPATEPAGKKLSAINAAVKLLESTGEPMTTKEMIEAMAEKGLWTSPGGQTPHATLYAAILREMNTKGTKSRFRKVAAGKFAYATPQD